MIREQAKEKAIKDIVKYRMTFKRSALFFIREKYPNLDFSDINFLEMRGHDIQDPDEGGSAQTERAGGVQESVQGEGVQVQAAEDTMFNPQSLGIESDEK